MKEILDFLEDATDRREGSADSIATVVSMKVLSPAEAARSRGARAATGYGIMNRSVSVGA